MSVKMQVVVQTVQGEQIIIDVLQCNPITGEKEYSSVQDMHDAMNDALTLCDMRVYEMRQRGIAGYELQKSCPPEAWPYVLDILEFMGGRQDLDMISRRWQSRIEENEALQQIRLAALQEQEVQELINGNGHGAV